MLGVAAVIRALDAVESGDVSEEHFTVIGDDWDIEERTRAQLDRLGLADLTLDRSLSTLSGGQVVSLGLAAQLLKRPDVLLLDERLFPSLTRYRSTIATRSSVAGAARNDGETRTPRGHRRPRRGRSLSAPTAAGRPLRPDLRPSRAVPYDHDHARPESTVWNGDDPCAPQ